MKGRIKLNHHRDLPMLIYIWKWKIATTASLHHKFFSPLSERTGYYRLARLKNHGFVAIRTDKFGQHPVWMLTKKGLQVILDYLPDLKEFGFQSENLWHDLLCSALHQGDFFLDQPRHVTLISEQQLRRYRNEDLPHWVPDPELHRPDGYIHIQDSNIPTTISLEVEKSRKSTAKITSLANHYADFNSNFRVLWVLDGKGLAQRLQACTNKANKDLNIHNIVLLKDFLDLGWQSQIISGPEANQSIRQFIRNKARTKPSKTHNTCSHKIILDNRLCYQKDRPINKTQN